MFCGNTIPLRWRPPDSQVWAGSSLAKDRSQKPDGMALDEAVGAADPFSGSPPLTALTIYLPSAVKSRQCPTGRSFCGPHPLSLARIFHYCPSNRRR